MTQDELYQVYVQRYKRQEKLYNAKGLNMATSLYNKAEFAAAYTAEYNSRTLGIKKDTAAGRRTGYNSIINTLISGQKYELSFAQGEALMKAVKAAGFNYDMDTIRNVNFGKWDQLTEDQLAEMTEADRAKYEEQLKQSLGYDFWNYLRQEYHRLRASGASAQSAKHYISQTFFGSN